jgi:glutamate/tyrosine decarboxylase-like PLP-dependent enzyme
VSRTTRLARRFADQLAAGEVAEVVNEVVFNQVLVRWLAPAGWDPDDFNDGVVNAIQREGTAYVSGTTWRGRRLMRISVSDWATDEDDVDRTVAAMLRCRDQVATAGPTSRWDSSPSRCSVADTKRPVSGRRMRGCC